MQVSDMQTHLIMCIMSNGIHHEPIETEGVSPAETSPCIATTVVKLI